MVAPDVEIDDGKGWYIHSCCRFVGVYLHELQEQFFYPIREFFSASEGSIIFSLRDINLTLGLLSSRRHVIWHDFVFCGCCEF